MRTKTQKSENWSNWSGNQTSQNSSFLQPRSEEELRDMLRENPAPIRIVGSGHSFTPIVTTQGSIINLDHMDGLVAVDATNNSVTVRAGARLKDLSPLLDQQGLAFKNLGDINEQSFAGATATATHGTGESLGCLSSEITAVKIMTAEGNIVEGSLSTNPDLVKAAQVSMGALGILLEATLTVRPSFRLHRRTWVEPIEAILDAAKERWAAHRNYEFFYIPFSGYGVNIAHDLSDAPETPRAANEDEEALAAIRFVRNKFKWSRFLRRHLLKIGLNRATPENVIGQSWQLLASTRNTRFNEMEYHLPVATALDAFNEVKVYIERNRPDVFFPIEMRKTAADEAWLSPFQAAPRISIAVHAAAEDEYEWFYKGVEPIFRAAGGRPHWGKLHSLGHDDLAELYPDFSKFTALRKRMDPEGLFLTPAIAKYWGER